MSGGVDSSAAALLLQKQGYECAGATLSLCGNETDGAKRIADGLGMPFYIFDEHELFAREVMDHFVSEYRAGRTPNPCIDCNRELKFGALLDRALTLGYDYIATGHYARVAYDAESGRYRLLRGAERRKDQSYVLYQLTQHQLAHLLLPVGNYDKPAIRDSARQAGLLNADKADSQDICFVPDGDYAEFLREYGHVAMEPGDFVDQDGHVLGRHKGLPCYTTGQRKGLGVSAGKHVYVVRKNAADNTILLGDNEDLFSGRLTACRVNWIAGQAPAGPIRVTAKTRYSQTEAEATVTPLEGQRIENVKGFYKIVGGRAGTTEYYMYDATNIRLRELSLSYQLPASWMEKSKVLKKAQVSFIARNLFFFYKKAPFDPDLVLSTGNDNQGIDVYGMPTTRSWGFSLKCEF